MSDLDTIKEMGGTINMKLLPDGCMGLRIRVAGYRLMDMSTGTFTPQDIEKCCGLLLDCIKENSNP